MNRVTFLWLLLILTLFFAGCSRKAPQVQISSQNKEAIEAILADKPLKFKVALEEELIAAHRLNYVDKIGIEGALLRLLSTSKNKMLSSDETFEGIKSIIVNKEFQDTYTYPVLLTKYLLDKDFMCKEPLYYDYFNNRYSVPDTEKVCEKKVPFKVLSKLGKEKIVWLDPKRVSDVHILFAGKGKAMMSQFGHISLRFIICPENDFSEEACNSNLYEHIVVGYRAHVNELKINTLKGLMGAYRAYLFANDFMDIYQEYTIGEFRDLYSLPLKLDKQNRENMLKAMSQIHWSYSGDYMFLTQNCSSLMQKTFAQIWEEFSQEPDMDEPYWRPDIFFDRLRVTSLTKSESLKDLIQAEEQGYFFPSTEPIYNKALKVVHAAMTNPDFEDLDTYINTDPIRRYADVVEDKDYYERLKKENYLREAQILLEELSMLRYEAHMMAELSYYLEKNKVSDITKHMDSELDESAYQVFLKCILEPILAYLQPIKRTEGIPSFLELTHTNDERYECNEVKNKEHLKQINEELEKLDPVNMMSIKVAKHYWIESINNVERFTKLTSLEKK